jgi:CubicO group peptidase (beta-lactamase class C family)
MDFPRDRNELQRIKAERWLLRSAGILSVCITTIIVISAFSASNSAETERFTYVPLPPLPDTLWMSRIYEWAEDATPLNSLLISFEDSLIAEHYFGAMGPDLQVNVKSVSKTLMSAMIGIALQKGIISDLDQRISDLLPGYFNEKTDPRKRDITIKNLITMRAGLEGTSFHKYNPWILSSDWIKYAIDRPITAPPGVRYEYSTGNTHLLSVILTEESGMSTYDFGRRYLFEPIGIKLKPWDRDPKGYYLGGNNMHLSPREMLRFGQLYLNNGLYGDKEILDREWIEDSWTPLKRSIFSSGGYGYGWWYRRTSGFDVYYAAGYGGQYIFVVPDLDLTVVATSSLTNRPRGRRPSVYSLLRSMIIPAIRDRIRNRIPAATDSLATPL